MEIRFEHCFARPERIVIVGGAVAPTIKERVFDIGRSIVFGCVGVTLIVGTFVAGSLAPPEARQSMMNSFVVGFVMTSAMTRR